MSGTERINDGGAAFPLPIATGLDGSIYNIAQQSGGECSGMTLRDWFAGQVLIGGCTSGLDPMHTPVWGGYPRIAKMSYEMADAMIAERDRKGTP